jgi:hypothetical protein
MWREKKKKRISQFCCSLITLGTPYELPLYVKQNNAFLMEVERGNGLEKVAMYIIEQFLAYHVHGMFQWAIHYP